MYGITIHHGKIYICDTGIRGLEIIDLEKRTFNFFIPKGKGELQVPINCFVDEKDNLYVADGKRNQIVIFDSTGKYVNSFGEGENFKPTDVFVSGKKIFVANIKDNRIQVYDKDSVGKFLYSFPDSEIENDNPAYLYSPANIFVTDEKVYVSDIGGFSVKVFSHDGNHLQTIGSYGKGLGQFSRNKGITVDRDGNIFVIDASFENAQVFNNEGKLLMFFGGPYQGPGYMWLPAKITVDYDNLKYFEQYVDPAYDLKYLILVTNQYGPDKINVYGYVEPAKMKRENVLYKKREKELRKKERVKEGYADTLSTKVQSKNLESDFSSIEINAEQQPVEAEKISVKKDEPINPQIASIVAVPASPPASTITDTPVKTTLPGATTGSSSENNIVFKIQIAANKNPLPPNHSVFQNLSGKIENEKGEDGFFRYFTGSFKKLEDANVYLNELLAKGANGYTVAFKDGKKIPLSEAVKLIK